MIPTVDTTLDTALARIRAYLQATGLSPAEIASRAGLAPNTVRAALKGCDGQVETWRCLERLIPASYDHAGTASRYTVRGESATLCVAEGPRVTQKNEPAGKKMESTGTIRPVASRNSAA